MHRSVPTSLVLALFLAACGGSSGDRTGTDGGSGTDLGPGTDAGGTDAGGGTDSGIVPESYSLTFGPVNVPPGGENTQCVVVRLHNPAMFRVGQIHNVLTDASHHFIVYRTNDTVEQTTPFDCAPFTDTLDPTKGSPLMISQKHDDTLQLPPGVAFTFEPDQMIRLELHFINTGSSDLPAMATANFVGIPEADFTDEAGFLFIGDPDINVPAHAAFTLGPVFFQLPAAYADAHFFAITGHEHRYGTNVNIQVAGDVAGPFTPVYDVPGWLWSEPATVVHDPPFMVPAGGGFQFTCDWDNPSATPATFGESATDEMCFFWAYYYPDHGAKVCIHTNRAGGAAGLDACCPGSPVCAFLAP